MKLYLQIPPREKTYVFCIPSRLVFNRLGFFCLKRGIQKNVPAVRQLRYKMFRPLFKCLRGFHKQGTCLLNADLQNDVHLSMYF